MISNIGEGQLSYGDEDIDGESLGTQDTTDNDQDKDDMDIDSD